MISFQAMVAMDLEGKIRRPRTEFDDERVRYEHRFAPLGQVSTPPLVPYVQFKEMTKARSHDKKDNKIIPLTVSNGLFLVRDLLTVGV